MIFESTVTILLNKPISYEGKTIDGINLDFSKATGRTASNVERKINKRGSMPLIPITSPEFCSYFAEELCGVPARALEKLSYTEYNYVWQTVAAFLAGLNPQKIYDGLIAGAALQDDDIVMIGGDADGDFIKPAQTPDMNQ